MHEIMIKIAIEIDQKDAHIENGRTFHSTPTLHL